MNTSRKGVAARSRRRVPSSLPATNAKRLRKGALATKQSTLPLAAPWIASLALAMTVSSAQRVARVVGEAVTRLFNVSDGGLRRSLSSGRALRGNCCGLLPSTTGVDTGQAPQENIPPPCRFQPVPFVLHSERGRGDQQ